MVGTKGSVLNCGYKFSRCTVLGFVAVKAKPHVNGVQTLVILLVSKFLNHPLLPEKAHQSSESSEFLQGKARPWRIKPRSHKQPVSTQSPSQEAKGTEDFMQKTSARWCKMRQGSPGRTSKVKKPGKPLVL